MTFNNRCPNKQKPRNNARGLDGKVDEPWGRFALSHPRPSTSGGLICSRADWNPVICGGVESTEKNDVGLSGGRVMPTSEEYRSYADHCLRWADETDSDEHRQAFLEMAKEWTQLALLQTQVQSQTTSAPAKWPPRSQGATVQHPRRSENRQGRG
jgi:hypothetical protein